MSKVEGRKSRAAAASSTLDPRPSTVHNAFTLVEVMVVVVLLSLIVVVLMGVFNSTQTAFRASVTQTDVLEGGRAAMDLMAQDLKATAPSMGVNNGAVNFCVTGYGYPPLYQSLVASGNMRANVQENFFILSLGNQNGVPTWFGTGYAVYLSPTNLYSLYRFSANSPVATPGMPGNLFYVSFRNFTNAPAGYSHLVDGVVGLRLTAFDVNGAPVTNSLPASLMRTNSLLNVPGQPGYVFFSNAVPASVEIEMATLEDRTLQRASTWPNNSIGQSNYLAQQSGKVHVFRQHVSIPNVDPSAYQ
jgi:prepilin-type N-terminal cleavage/methylation domain-containing protein